MKIKKICIVTGSRAEYGLLSSLMKEIKNDKDLVLQIVVTGMHLSNEFGLTYKDIEKDGFKIDRKVEMLLSSDTETGIIKSIGLGVIGFAEALKDLNPDILVLLGDRFELLSVISASIIRKLPVAHLHGGEITEGSYDDIIRNVITKISLLHFASTEEYKKRIIQMGEEPKRVFNVGAIGLDNIKNIKLLSKNEIEKELNFKFNQYNILTTFHPATMENNTSHHSFRNLLSALNKLKNHFIIFTKANADTNGRIINQMIDEYVKKHPEKSKVFISLGQVKYLSLMKHVNAVVGNSSSGIIEAPSFKIGTINIGDRQKGRIKVGSIIDCAPNEKSIRKAFNLLYTSGFQKKLKYIINPYGDGRTAKRIKNILKKISLQPDDIKKRFYNIPGFYLRNY